MPELPEVMRIAESINKHFAGKTFIRLTINEKSRYRNKELKGINFLTRGLQLLNVKGLRKRIIFIFYNHTTHNYIILFSFLAMEGRWLLTPQKHTGIIIEMGRIKKVGIRNINVIEKTLFYDDMRHQGTLSVLITQDDIDNAFKDLGPDYLNDNITYEMYYDKIKNTRTLHKKISWWMLEQKYFSGIGNYLRAEILYHSHISPHRTLDSLSDNDIHNLFEFSLKIIKDSYLSHGLTIATYMDPDGNIGTYNTAVYKKQKDPNGYDVIKEKTDNDRTIHWCPTLQK